MFLAHKIGFPQQSIVGHDREMDPKMVPKGPWKDSNDTEIRGEKSSTGTSKRKAIGEEIT